MLCEDRVGRMLLSRTLQGKVRALMKSQRQVLHRPRVNVEKKISALHGEVVMMHFTTLVQPKHTNIACAAYLTSGPVLTSTRDGIT